MKRFGMALLVLCGFASGIVGATRADFRDPPNAGLPAGIWPDIVFVQAGNFKEFEETMSQSRDEVRKMLFKELTDVLKPLVEAGAEAASTAKVLAEILLTFDGMHEVHKDEAVKGIPKSLESIFRAELDELHSRYDVRDHRRRTEFVRNAQVVEAVHSATRSGSPLSTETALQLYTSVDYFMYGSYTIIRGGNVELTLTIEKYYSGQTRSFSARGPIHQAIKALARKVFDFFQSNQYEEWSNPQPHLQWLPAPKRNNREEDHPSQYDTWTAADARLYCRGQRARIPYARELILAAQGGEYAPGGIKYFNPNEIYLVADRQRWDMQHYYFVGQEGATGGAVRTDAGYGTIKAKFWCVRGEPSMDIRFHEDLYRLLRKTPDPSIKRAVEYILTQLEDTGARPEYRDEFPDLDTALEFLRSKDVIVRVPADMR